MFEGDEGVETIETVLPFRSGDCLLLFTDGATEVAKADGRQLGADGLLDCLRRLGYPQAQPAFKEIEESILRASDKVRFDDDLTFLEIRRR